MDDLEVEQIGELASEIANRLLEANNGLARARAILILLSDLSEEAPESMQAASDTEAVTIDFTGSTDRRSALRDLMATLDKFEAPTEDLQRLTTCVKNAFYTPGSGDKSKFPFSQKREGPCSVQIYREDDVLRLKCFTFRTPTWSGPPGDKA